MEIQSMIYTIFERFENFSKMVQNLVNDLAALYSRGLYTRHSVEFMQNFSFTIRF